MVEGAAAFDELTSSGSGYQLVAQGRMLGEWLDRRSINFPQWNYVAACPGQRSVLIEGSECAFDERLHVIVTPRLCGREQASESLIWLPIQLYAFKWIQCSGQPNFITSGEFI